MKNRKGGNNFKTFESTTQNAKHYRITHNMINSEAWKDLDIYARDLYHNMKSKFNFNNENNISFTYEEGMKLMSKASFTKAIDNLIEHGFIYIVENGRALRKANIYGFSDNWQKYPNIDIIPRPKRSRGDTEKDSSPKGKKQILARSKVTEFTRLNMTYDKARKAK